MSSSQSESITSLDETSPAETSALRRDSPRERADVVDERSHAANQPELPRSPGQQRLRLTLFLLLPIVLIGAGFWYVYGGQVISTDDAYVNAQKVGISTDVSGMVAAVEVHDNQQVTAGQVLYRLDPLPFQIALEQAEADRAEIALSLRAMQRDYRRMLAEAAAAQSQVKLDRTNYARAVRLLANGVESRADYDQTRDPLAAVPAGRGAGSRSAPRAEALGGPCAVCRSGYRCVRHRPRQVSGGLGHRLLSRRYPSLVGGSEAEGDAAHLRETG
jgi:hypothetical protein